MPLMNFGDVKIKPNWRECRKVRRGELTATGYFPTLSCFMFEIEEVDKNGRD